LQERRQDGFRVLVEEIVNCKLCPRLAAHCSAMARVKRRAYRDWDYWGKPVPPFGDPRARLLVIGLAPAAHGGNRTGRIFTGDRSGDWLYRALYNFGFANQPNSTDRLDGLRLLDCYITAAIHCAPPDNKPLPSEFANCRPYFLEELQQLKNVKIVVPLGLIGFKTYFSSRKQLGLPTPSPLPPFGHSLSARLPDGITVISSYHPSQQNTQTGKLTEKMLDDVFRKARKILDKKNAGTKNSGSDGSIPIFHEK
jgi:uracil-DNA glycosylase